MIETLLNLYNGFYYSLLTFGLIALIIAVPIIIVDWVCGVLKDGIRNRIKTFFKQSFCDHEMRPNHDIGYIWQCRKCGYWYQRTG